MSRRLDHDWFPGELPDNVFLEANIDALKEPFEPVLVHHDFKPNNLNFDPDDPNRKRMGVWATSARLSPASVKRVMRLVEKLAAIDHDQDADGADYGLLVGFYPRASKEHDR